MLTRTPDRFLSTLTLLLAVACASALAEEEAIPRLDPLYRHSILVSDLEQSLTLYRDTLGMQVSRISDIAEGSYSYRFFNIPKGSMRRFAYLHGDDEHGEVLGLGEAPGVDLDLPDTRTSAFVMTVADPEDLLEKVRAMGLEVVEPYEFTSRTGPQGIEFGVVDFDGHLILLYGLKVSELRPDTDS